MEEEEAIGKTGGAAREEGGIPETFCEEQVVVSVQCFNEAMEEAPVSFGIHFISVAQSCPTLCHPMDCSTPGLPVHHQLLEFTQTHVD